jgi:phosphohistidine phosphatase
MADPSDLLVDRTLVLLRHAKAVHPESMPDLDRPLADRGRADAAAAGRWLVAEGIEADLVLCSPAQRTRETWEYAASAGAVAANVWYDRRIYTGATEDLLDVIREAPAETRTVILVGHAPALPRLANELTTESTSPKRVELTRKYPTSGLAVLQTTRRWTDLAPGETDLVDYVIPRG